MGSFFRTAVAVLAVATTVVAQRQRETQDDDGDGYIGYNLDRRGDDSTDYQTAFQSTGRRELSPEPDIYLNASVGVEAIIIQVDNITAKVNLDAKVLNLLHFSAGVDASIDRVKLSIINISAEVELEARLENVVEMIADVLHSIDLNPIIATLGRNVNSIVNNVTGTLGRKVDQNGNPIQQPQQPAQGQPAQPAQPGQPAAPAQPARRGLEYDMANNILYSINDYSGSTHTNRMLANNGSLVDVYLDNAGDEWGQTIVGFYSRDMSFTGHNRTIAIDGKVVEYELRYLYRPYPGLEITSNIYMNTEGKVVRTRVIAEAEAGGTSHISDDNGSNDL